MISWWQNIVFEWGWVLWFLPAIPPFAILIYYMGGRGRPALSLSSFSYLKGVATPSIVKWRTVLYLFRFCAAILIVIALARPQSRTEFKKRQGEGIDIMIIVDISRSMKAIDFLPTRLEAAKREAIRFVETRKNDRIGVVVFSGEPFTVCPLTTDHDALKILIRNITPNEGQFEQGTAIGMGLAKGIERLQASTAKSKVAVLLTDGENFGGRIQPFDAARMAKTYNIRLYTIGMGALEGKVAAPSQQDNSDGTPRMEYQEVSIDEAMLSEMATHTGGRYFRAGDDKMLENIYSEINKLETSEYDKNRIEERKEEFLPFLLLALFFIVFEFTLRYTTFDSLT